MAASGIRARGKAAAKPKPARKTRTRPRVQESEEKSKTAKKKAEHTPAPMLGTMQYVPPGTMEFYVQESELVPVAQYANVTIGPVAMKFSTSDPGIELLADVDWTDDTPLSAEQQAVYDKLRGILAAASNILTHHIDDDRELVENSVAAHNAREAEKEKKSTSGRRKKS